MKTIFYILLILLIVKCEDQNNFELQITPGIVRDRSIELIWEEPTVKVVSCTISYSEVGKTWISETSEGIPPRAISGLNPSTEYLVRVILNYENGSSNWSNTILVKTLANSQGDQPPPPPID